MGNNNFDQNQNGFDSVYQQPQNQQPQNQQPQPQYQQPQYQQPQYQQPPMTDLEPPMTIGDWMITTLLMCVPCVNFIMLIIWAVGGNGTPKTKTNWARATFIWTAIILVFYIILIAIMGASFATMMSRGGGSYSGLFMF